MTDEITNRCGTCVHWLDIDAERKCPRLSRAVAQAVGYIAANKGKPNLPRKVFEGTGATSGACPEYASVLRRIGREPK